MADMNICNQLPSTTCVHVSQLNLAQVCRMSNEPGSFQVDGGWGDGKAGVSIKSKEAKELNPPPPEPKNRPKLLGAQNRVFGCLGDPELDHPFCSDLDGRAGCWISTHTSLAIDQNDLAQPRNREGILGVFVRQGHQGFD